MQHQFQALLQSCLCNLLQFFSLLLLLLLCANSLCCPRVQIRFLLLQNRQGKTRLSKWYIPLYDEQEKNKIENDVHRLVVSRDRKYTNFIEYQVSANDQKGLVVLHAAQLDPNASA
jgi:Clathrin adaptor complex small chain